jgi:hypothetical protein
MAFQGRKLWTMKEDEIEFDTKIGLAREPPSATRPLPLPGGGLQHARTPTEGNTKHNRIVAFLRTHYENMELEIGVGNSNKPRRVSAP